MCDKEIIKKVTVIVPTYNRPDYLERLLKSMISDEPYIYEVIIVNDNSKNLNEYAKVIEEFSSVFNIRYIVNNTNMGAPYGRNLGIDLAETEYLAFTDDDDEWEEEKLKFQVPKLNGDTGLVYTWAKAVNEEGQEVYNYNAEFSGKCIVELLKSDFIPSSSVLISRSAIIKAGKFDEKMPSCQDWDMWLRIMKAGYAIDVVKKHLLIYHKHSGPSIGNSKKAQGGYRRYYRKHIGCYIYHFFFSRDFREYALNGVRRRINGKHK